MMKILECHSPLPDKTIALSYKHKQWIQSMEEVKMSGGGQHQIHFSNTASHSYQSNLTVIFFQ